MKSRLEPAFLLAFLLCFTLSPVFAQVPSSQKPSETIVIDANAPATPFPHFWDRMFGSGRAILALRESYRNDLRDVKKATDFQYVRFHAIFHDEVGVYDEDEDGKPVYNFSYVDQIYDGLLANGVRPVVEIGFMPKKLAARQDVHAFWYKQIVAPPKDYEKWDDFIRSFAKHLVERYGLDEVSQWYFEIWNEPNIDFWTGEPKQSTYFELYDHTARALKAVSPRLRVGGPSTAAADWVDDFLKHTAAKRVPVDFVSSHGYADDTVEHLLHTNENIQVDQRVCRAIGKVHNQIRASTTPNLPLFWTEWNVPSFGEKYHARDTTYVGAALAETVRQCDGLVRMMSFWTFSDVFEESGPVRTPFYGGFGLVAAGGIHKPSFNAFALLHKLGDQRIPSDSTKVLVTRRGEKGLAIAVWNLVDPNQSGTEQRVRLQFRNVGPNAKATLTRLDSTHGNVLPAYGKMGRPRYPTRSQIQELNRAGKVPKPEAVTIRQNSLDLILQPNALFLLEISR